jgi:hypothetical protein
VVGDGGVRTTAVGVGAAGATRIGVGGAGWSGVVVGSGATVGCGGGGLDLLPPAAVGSVVGLRPVCPPVTGERGAVGRGAAGVDADTGVFRTTATCVPAGPLPGFAIAGSVAVADAPAW